MEYPIQMTVATTDGETTWAFRYSSKGQSRSLFHSTDVSALREQYPDNPLLHELSDDARLIVSEPLGDLQRCLERGARSHLRRRPRRPRGTATVHPEGPGPGGLTARLTLLG